MFQLGFLCRFIITAIWTFLFCVLWSMILLSSNTSWLQSRKWGFNKIPKLIRFFILNLCFNCIKMWWLLIISIVAVNFIWIRASCWLLCDIRWEVHCWHRREILLLLLLLLCLHLIEGILKFMLIIICIWGDIVVSICLLRNIVVIYKIVVSIIAITVVLIMKDV